MRKQPVSQRSSMDTAAQCMELASVPTGRITLNNLLQKLAVSFYY